MEKWLPILKRGMTQRCPQCGKSKIFISWGLLKESCEQCGLKIREREHDTWFFMYMSTAAITGGFIIFLLLYKPQNQILGRTVITLVAALTFICTQSMRKSLAVAIDYIVDSRSRYPRT